MNIAVVTGASSGLGQEFIRRLDAEKFDEIWAVARRKERLEALGKEIATRLRVLPYDLTDRKSFRELSALLAAEKPCVRVLINAAGFGKIGSWSDISLDDCDNMIDLNCRAAVDMTQIMLPYLPRGGRILQICSTAAFQPFQFLNVYAATKSFLYRYSRALRLELLPRGVKVTAVCPYWIKDTEFIATAKKTGNSSYVRSFPLASRTGLVAALALNDSSLGFAVSTPGLICTLHRIVAKFIPGEVMMGLWELIRRL
jgi:short-subunit dehydrogenase